MNEIDSDSYLLEVGRAAMACQFQVLLNADQAKAGTESAVEALELLDILEARWSPFQASSEISRINREAANQPLEVSASTAELIQIGLRIFEATGGAFDLTAASLSETWGFSRRQGKMPTQEDIDAALQKIGSDAIRLDFTPMDIPPAAEADGLLPNTAVQQSTASVSFLRPGLKINPGGIGKGLALDRIASHLESAGIRNFMIHGGKSSILARGNRAHRLTGGGWLVALRHPLRPDRRLGQIRLRDQALGTSGAANQYFHFQGKRYGHVIDPRTGWPADKCLSMTILAKSGAEADALATGFFVEGPTAAIEYLERNPAIGMICAVPGERDGSLDIITKNLGPDQWIPE